MRRRLMILSGLVAVLTVWGAGAASAATRWAIQPTPNPSGATFPQLNDVSCASASSCTAVGLYTTGAGITRTLAEHWNGSTWAVQATPDPAGAGLSVFYGVSCAAAARCTAVGRYNTSDSGELPLAEHWNGSTWTIQNPSGPAEAELTGVSCISATSCTATGDDQLGTLAEHWNGSTWAIQATLNPTGAEFPSLSHVSCASATSCTAVGFYSLNSEVLPLAEDWNGSTWAIQSAPNPSGSPFTQLSGVSCTSTSSCTAVGFYSATSGTVLTLAEHYNGSTWAIQAARNPAGSPNAHLAGVSCTSATSCTAAGWYTVSTTDNDVLTLAEHYNGSTWAIAATPNPAGAAASQLEGISCPNATSCTAAGLYAISSGPSFTFAEHR